jgi:hypothetical protein
MDEFGLVPVESVAPRQVCYTCGRDVPLGSDMYCDICRPIHSKITIYVCEWCGKEKNPDAWGECQDCFIELQLIRLGWKLKKMSTVDMVLFSGVIEIAAMRLMNDEDNPVRVVQALNELKAITRRVLA